MSDPGGETTEGYRFWPECVEYTVTRATAKSGPPVIVTENGIGTVATRNASATWGEPSGDCDACSRGL